MKLTELFVMTCCSIIVARSETAETDRQALLQRASEQLERLEPYRKISADREALDPPKPPEAQRLPDLNQSDLDRTESNVDPNIPWEILELLSEQTEADETTKRNDGEKETSFDIISDTDYAATMQDRIKRGYDHHPPTGSASLITGIAGGVLSGVGSASKGSAAHASSFSDPGYHKPSYGSPPVYSYTEHHPVGPWDMKKAIFSTVFQALKAISGGVLALKGQLVKGSGYLLSAKSKVISKTGDVITTFGKHLASTAAEQLKPHSPATYSYEQHPPPAQNLEQDPNYPGPPPTSDDYSEANNYSPHSSYGVPTDDIDQGGLLIVTPTKSDLDEQGDQGTIAIHEKPDLTKLEESFGGPSKGSIIKDLLSSLPKGSGGTKGDRPAIAVGEDSNNYDSNVNADSYPPVQHPEPAYGTPNLQPDIYDKPGQIYGYPVDQGNVHHQPVLPPIPPSHLFPHLGIGSPTPVHPNGLYSPLHAPQFGYPQPNGFPLNELLHASEVPKAPHDDGLSVYASVSIDTEPQRFARLKTPVAGYLDLPKLQPHVNFHGQPHLAGLHGSLEGPLRIQLLNTLPASYWQGQGTPNPFLKRYGLHRRRSANRFARYSSSPAKLRRRA